MELDIFIVAAQNLNKKNESLLASFWPFFSRIWLIPFKRPILTNDCNALFVLKNERQAKKKDTLSRYKFIFSQNNYFLSIILLSSFQINFIYLEMKSN